MSLHGDTDISLFSDSSDEEASAVFMPRRANVTPCNRPSNEETEITTPPALQAVEHFQDAQEVSPDVTESSYTGHSSVSAAQSDVQAADPVSIDAVDLALTDSSPTALRARTRSELELELLTQQRIINTARPTFLPMTLKQERGLFDTLPLNQAYDEHRSPSEWSCENKSPNAPPHKRLDYYRRCLHRLERKLNMVRNGGQLPVPEDETEAARRAESTRRCREWKLTDEAVWTQAEYNLQCFDDQGNNTIAARRREIRNSPWTPIQMLEEYEVTQEEQEEQRLGLVLREVVVRDIAPLIRVSNLSSR